MYRFDLLTGKLPSVTLMLIWELKNDGRKYYFHCF